MSDGSPGGVRDEMAAHTIRQQHGTERTVQAVTAGEDDSISRVEGHAASFETWTDDELRKRAHEVGVDWEDKSREQLIEELEGY